MLSFAGWAALHCAALCSFQRHLFPLPMESIVIIWGEKPTSTYQQKLQNSSQKHQHEMDGIPAFNALPWPLMLSKSS